MSKIEDKNQWHMGFYGAMELEFRLEKELLEFNREFQLSKKPLEMDMLIIKKRTNVQLINEIGKIFRKHNIIEYKSPKDTLGVDQFFKGLSYACLYKSQGKTTDEIKANEITLTFIRDIFPRKLMKWLGESGYIVECNIPGIYIISGNIPFLIQIVVSRELDNKNHLSLRLLSKQLDIESAKNFIEKATSYKNQGDRENVEAVLKISVNANKILYNKILEDEDMGDVLLDLMKDKIDAKVSAGRAEGKVEGKLESIRALMVNLNYTAEQAMESIGIPKSEYNKYIKELK